MKKVIEASEAVALAAKLCKPDVIGVYPITPQTHIPERIADYIYDGEMEELSSCVEPETTFQVSCWMGWESVCSSVFDE